MGKQVEDRGNAVREDAKASQGQPTGTQFPALAQVRDMLAAGTPDPQAIAALIQEQPEARLQIYELLHRTLGNRFVAQVETALAPEASVPAVAETPAPVVAEEQSTETTAPAPSALPSPGPGGKGSAKKTPLPAGSLEAMTELQDEIANGIPHPERIARLAVMLTYPDRVSVRDTQLANFEAKLTPAQTIAVYEALGQTTLNTVAAAVRRGAAARELSTMISHLDISDLVEIAEDPSLIRSLRAALPGSLLQYTPPHVVGSREVAESGPLVRWLIESSTPRQIWHEIRTAGAMAELVGTLESEQLWGWVSSLTAHGMTSIDTYFLNELVKIAPEGIKPQFEALAAASPGEYPLMRSGGRTDEETAALQKQQVKEHHDAGTKLLKQLASKEALTADDVMDGVAAAQTGARVIGGDDAARKKVVALLDVEQLSTFVRVAGFSLANRLDWLLDKKGLASGYLVEQLRGADLETALSNDARTKRLHDRIGDDLDLTAVTGMTGALQTAALSHQPLRALILGKKPTARQIVRFVTAGESADSIAAACKVIAKDHGYDWVYELSSGVESDATLRRLSIACPDRGARKHLARYAVTNFALEKNTTIDAPEATDASVYQGEEEHLKDDAKADPGSVAADAIEMSEDARANMRKDRAQVNAAIEAAAGSSNLGMDAVRTARELNGTLPETLRSVSADASQIDHSAFRSYARERPGEEQLEAAGDPKLAAIAEKLLNYSPLHTLPALRSSAGLAKALGTNPGLLSWIERSTSPLEALDLLGDNAVIAKITAGIMESSKSFGLIKGLPRSGLTVDQRAALARIGAEATGQKLHEAVGDRLEDNAENDGKKGPPTKPDNGKSLGVVLDELVQRKASAKEIQAACSAHPVQEAMEVLFARKSPHIKTLRDLRVSPLTIFPELAELPAATLHASIDMTDWLLATEEPLGLLRSIAGTEKALLNVAVAIDIDRNGANHFLSYLPQGHGLAEGDEATLHAIYTMVTSDAAAMSLFMARFGHAPEGDWSRAALDSMWVTLSRLPDRQVEANLKFGGLTRGDPNDTSGLAGSYTPGTGVVMIRGEGGDDSRYQTANWLSKAQLAVQLGVDEAEIDRRYDAKRLEKQTVDGKELFRVKAVEGAGFTYTLLHEMGHAVDALLGNRTDLVFGMAGWKSYATGDFDAWAEDMGAWQGATVSDEDKSDTRYIFEQYMQSSSAIYGPAGDVGDLAPSDHAMKKRDNRSAFLMKAASTPNAFKFYAPVEHNGRRYVMNHYYGRFMSYDAKIHDILPLPYAGFAPEEFFAECYVEYYRDVAVPGGNLPAWIRTWFDENVNRIGHGPAKKP